MGRGKWAPGNLDTALNIAGQKKIIVIKLEKTVI